VRRMPRLALGGLYARARASVYVCVRVRVRVRCLCARVCASAYARVSLCLCIVCACVRARAGVPLASLCHVRARVHRAAAQEHRRGHAGHDALAQCPRAHRKQRLRVPSGTRGSCGCVRASERVSRSLSVREWRWAGRWGGAEEDCEGEGGRGSGRM
jgi:hypothetical protein